MKNDETNQRCETCRHWSEDRSTYRDYRMCNYLSGENDSIDLNEGPIWTSPQFACIHYDAKKSTPE